MLAGLAERDAHLAPTGAPRRLPASQGGANQVFRVPAAGGPVIVKIRENPEDSAEAERWALGLCPRGTGPRLLGVATVRQQCARLAQAGRFRDLPAVDVPLGTALVLEHLAGRSLPGSPSLDTVRAVGRAVAALHQVKPAEGPRLRTGSSPRGLCSLTARLVEQSERLGLPHGVLARLRAGQRAAEARASHDELRLERVRTLCHGDLRWHNLLDDKGRIRLLDFEHAGIGDPALDLALMAVRTPLDEREELALLDGYLEARTDGSLLDRYFALLPLAGFVGAVAGVHDLLLAAAGRRRVHGDRATWVARQTERVAPELDDALARLGARRSPRAAPLTRPKVVPRTARRRRGRGLGGVLAMDGTAASGKSVLAREVALRYGVPHYNTGAAYRAAAYLALEVGLAPRRARDVERLVQKLARAEVVLLPQGGVRVGGQELFEALAVIEIDEVVAEWAALAAVRAAVGKKLAPFLGAPAVVEGRDVGTVLCPNARAKVFVDADPAVRAERAHGRLGRKLTLARMRRLNDRRDHLDATRALAPMVAAPDAVRVDTTRGDIDENVRRVLRALETARAGGRAAGARRSAAKKRGAKR